jgi:hypothetical protein
LFLANHLGALTFSSIVTSSDRSGDDDVINAGVLSFRSAPASGAAPCYRGRGTVVDWPQSLQRAPSCSLDARAGQHRRGRAGLSSSRGPPKSWAVTIRSERMSGGSFVGIPHLGHQWTGRDRSLAPAGSPSAVLNGDELIGRHFIHVILQLESLYSNG